MYTLLLWASFQNVTTSGLSILMHGIIRIPDATSYDNEELSI